MDRMIATGVGVAAALAASPSLGAQAIDGPAVPVAASYADLLQPIPDAQARLAQSDAEAAARPAVLIPAQYAYHHHHHHHHHSNDWYRENGYYWSGGAWLLGPRPHHHHHHYRASWYRRHGYYWSGDAWLIGPRPHHHHHHHHNNY